MPAPLTPGGKRMPYSEFIVICAMTMALTALAIDIVIPAILLIGEVYGVVEENDRQWLITAYLLPFGIGQLFAGSLADRFGRKPVMLLGLVGYAAASIAAPFAPDFNTLLILRGLAGLSASAGRVAVVALVRDCFVGRDMASVMSIVMMVFMAIPILAPLFGQVLMELSSWALIFDAMAVLAAALFVWISLRLPETLAPENQRSLRFASVAEGFRIVLSTRRSIGYSLAMSAVFGSLFGFVNSSAQIYLNLYEVGRAFPLYFSVGGVMIAISSLINSRLVQRLGMHVLSHSAVLGFIGTALILLVLVVMMDGLPPLWLFVGATAILLFLFGFIGTNFNALAMEPLGAQAGTATAIFGFMQSSISASLGGLIGYAYNETVVPLLCGFLLCGCLAFVLILFGERGRYFGTSGGRTKLPAV